MEGFERESILLSDGKTALSLYHYITLDSTNAEAKRRGAAECAVILSDGQTAGRGRLGRDFYSEGGIYLSVILPAKGLLLSPMLLTSAAAVAVCRALEGAGLDGRIKWVNDILLDGRKLCGILAEAVSTGDGITGYVIGIGVNIGSTELPKELSDIATAVFLSEEGKRELAYEIVRRLMETIEMSPEDILAYCTAKSTVLGRRVRFFGAKNGVGLAVGLSPEGGLIVEADGGETVILTGGEISLRPE